MRVIVALLVVLLGGCADAPADVQAPDEGGLRTSMPSATLPKDARLTGEWILATPTLAVQATRMHTFHLERPANVTVAVEMDGPLAMGTRITMYLDQDVPQAPLAQSGGESAANLTVRLDPGSYRAYGSLDLGAKAQYTMTVSFRD